jgi:ribose transport system permease protein
MIFVVAIAFVLVMQLLLRRTVWGRRFDLVGANPAAARAAGLRIERVQLSSYVIAGFCYAMAGALLAGYLGRPQLFAGEEYLLTSIAAVVLGGTALGGGRGSVVATFAGVLFISQLNQVVLLLGATQAVQFMIQGAIIALGMGLRNVPWHSLRGGKTEGSEPDPPATSGQVEGQGGSSNEVDPHRRIEEAGDGEQMPPPGVVKQ